MVTIVDIPPGPAGVPVLASAIRRIIDDSTTVIAPVPQVGPHMPSNLRESLIAGLSATTVSESGSADAAGHDVGTDVQVLLTTSGSTGAPKVVMHALAAIQHSAAALHQRLGGSGHWLCALPLHSSAGFMTVARAVVAGTQAIGMNSLAGATSFTAEGFSSAAEELLALAGRHYVSLVPAQAERLLQSSHAREVLSHFDAVLLGGQAIPEDLTANLAAAKVRVVLSYGSTETCGGCVYDGVALDGVDVRVVDGAVTIAGPVVMRGYKGNIGLGSGLNDDGSFTMPDRGELVDDRLRILGRSDDMVIIKGINVSPSRVEGLLAGMGVGAVVVADERAENLIAVIESRGQTGGERADNADAVNAVRRHLGLPLSLAEISAWPMLASGKPDRRAIAAHINSHMKLGE